MSNKNDKYNQHVELKDLAPNLSNLNKADSFVVPENYFDELNDRIHQKISRERSQMQNSRIISLFSKPAIISALAAASVIVFFAIFLFTKQGGESTDYYSGITFEQIMEESPELIESMEHYLMIEVLYSVSENFDESNYIDFLDEDSTLQTDELIDYLSDEDMENEFYYN